MNYPANIQRVLQDVTAPVGESVDTILQDLVPDVINLRYPGVNHDLPAIVAKVRAGLTLAMVELDRLDVIFDHADELGRLVGDLQKQAEPEPLGEGPDGPSAPPAWAVAAFPEDFAQVPPPTTTEPAEA